MKDFDDNIRFSVNNGNVEASGSLKITGSVNFSSLPTTEPTITGSLWISGSSIAHPNSGYLMVFNP